MISMAVLYNKTDDPDTFEKRYIAEHIPLVGGWAGLKSPRFGKVTGAIAGEAPFTHMFVGNWESAEALQADLGSDATGPIMANASELAPEGFTAVTMEWLA